MLKMKYTDRSPFQKILKLSNGYGMRLLFNTKQQLSVKFYKIVSV